MKKCVHHVMCLFLAVFLFYTDAYAELGNIKKRQAGTLIALSDSLYVSLFTIGSSG